jgi:hypothetical protein
LLLVLPKIIGTLSFVVVLKSDAICFVVFSWVRPEQVTKDAFKGSFLESIEFVNLFKFLQLWTNSSMQHKVLAFNSGGQRHGVKEFHKLFVSVHIKLLYHFFSKRKMFSHISAFVVPS